MNVRQGEGHDMAISIRMSKEEWEEVKASGEASFKDRNVGYMNVVPGKVQFDIISPYYKDKRELDTKNKHKSEEEISTDKAVRAEISKKVK